MSTGKKKQIVNDYTGQKRKTCQVQNTCIKKARKSSHKVCVGKHQEAQKSTNNNVNIEKIVLKNQEKNDVNELQKMRVREVTVHQLTICMRTQKVEFR